MIIKKYIKVAYDNDKIEEYQVKDYTVRGSEITLFLIIIQQRRRNMFYIVENNSCLYITPTMKDANDWMKMNNKTIYKVYQDEYKKVIVEVK